MTHVALAFEYLHKRGFCYNALVPGNVVLMRYWVNQDPTAKLSNFAKCRHDKSKLLLRKDISDFGALLYTVLTSTKRGLRRLSETSGFDADAAPLPGLVDLEGSCPAAALLIRDALGGRLSPSWHKPLVDNPE